MTEGHGAYERGAHRARMGQGMDYCDEPTAALRIWWVLGFQSVTKVAGGGDWEKDAPWRKKGRI